MKLFQPDWLSSTEWTFSDEELRDRKRKGGDVVDVEELKERWRQIST
jgi:hypothetical protein